jgi:hypothetical protein
MNKEILSGNKLAEGVTFSRGNLRIMVVDVLIWAISKSAVCVRQEQPGPAIIFLRNCLADLLPEHFDGVKVRPTMRCMSSDNNTLEASGMHFDDHETGICGDNCKIIIIKPALTMRLTVMLESKRLLFGESQQDAKLSFAICRGVPQKIIRAMKAHTGPKSSLLQSKNGDIGL